jgi:hypothetical protein
VLPLRQLRIDERLQLRGPAVTDSAAKEWTFAVDAKGGHHKMDKLKADGKPAVIGEFVAEKDKVAVKYGEKDGKLIAKEVHVEK